MPAEVATKVGAWFLRVDPTVLVLTPEQWAAREHKDLHANGALCIVIHDGGEFSRYGSLAAWNKFKKAFPDCWEEQLTGWATAIYKKEA